MNTLELKKSLITKISEINDIDFLNALKSFLENRSETKTVFLSKNLKKEINDSRKQINDHFFIDSETLNQEVKEWANKK